MGKAVVIMLLMLTAIATVCRSANEAERGVENVKEKVGDVAENVKVTTEGALNEAKDKSGTWADWAVTKVTSGLGKGSAHSAVDKAGDAASKSTSALNSAASGNYVTCIYKCSCLCMSLDALMRDRLLK
ncbi:hypothetical protein HanOQP8_Chr11g0389541 [Helianthus annuus]|nr:hypothetical protein HanOQP8_Chr11g0389541 [Helianthus annuus]